MYPCCVPSYSHLSCFHSQSFHGWHLSAQWNSCLQLPKPQKCTDRVFCSGNQIRLPASLLLLAAVKIPWQPAHTMTKQECIQLYRCFGFCSAQLVQTVWSELAIFVWRGKERGRDLHASEKGTGIYLVSKLELFLMCQSSVSAFLLHILSSYDPK